MNQDRPEIDQLVGGLVNGACLLTGVYTGGQPAEEELDALAAAGVRTVLDTRAPDEYRGFDEGRAVREAGMDYVVLPVTPYTLTPATFDRFRELLKAEERRPVLVHCASGNRVGALLVPYLILDEGRSPDEALELAVASGLRSQALLDVAMAYVERASP
jgi:uncharacterized protein (TIGR01244 family)